MHIEFRARARVCVCVCVCGVEEDIVERLVLYAYTGVSEGRGESHLLWKMVWLIKLMVCLTANKWTDIGKMLCSKQ